MSRVSRRKPRGAPRCRRGPAAAPGARARSGACSSAEELERLGGEDLRQRALGARGRGPRAHRSLSSDRVVEQGHRVVDRHGRAVEVGGDLHRAAGVGGGDRRRRRWRRGWRPCGGRARRRPPAGSGCRCRPSRSRAPTRRARPARGRGCRAAARAAGCGCPGRGRGGRRRGRRRVSCERVARRPRRVLGEQLVHVAHLGRERPRALRPLRVVGEQVAVVLHRRAAAGDVDRDGS